jgi:hypothetical protein
MLIAMINGSIHLIVQSDSFYGIGVDPLASANKSYLLWVILGFHDAVRSVAPGRHRGRRGPS